MVVLVYCCVVYVVVLSVLYLLVFVFFFKQKTAYEMRISDWSSDVCSSDLLKRFSELDAKRFAVVKVGGAVLRDELSDLASSLTFLQQEIGRASCRERVCQYV